ncbi:hypothetical_protein [Candidozyma auris]|uniref:hypothetical_protein n=1 Tax=Candidozyma auris TaxID=498019 RepID=UPI000D2AA3A3|nr:hypothetical_protein [[Candida] auris]QEO23490.1 hypothetical_protein [[Candida] auris]GBL51924.1 hypothetical protein CAJCM15448_41980 [[Candida] auris]
MIPMFTYLVTPTLSTLPGLKGQAAVAESFWSKDELQHFMSLFGDFLLDPSKKDLVEKYFLEKIRDETNSSNQVKSQVLDTPPASDRENFSSSDSDSDSDVPLPPAQSPQSELIESSAEDSLSEIVDEMVKLIVSPIVEESSNQHQQLSKNARKREKRKQKRDLKRQLKKERHEKYLRQPFKLTSCAKKRKLALERKDHEDELLRCQQIKNSLSVLSEESEKAVLPGNHLQVSAFSYCHPLKKLDRYYKEMISLLDFYHYHENLRLVHNLLSQGCQQGFITRVKGLKSTFIINEVDEEIDDFDDILNEGSSLVSKEEVVSEPEEKVHDVGGEEEKVQEAAHDQVHEEVESKKVQEEVGQQEKPAQKSRKRRSGKKQGSKDYSAQTQTASKIRREKKKEAERRKRFPNAGKSHVVVRPFATSAAMSKPQPVEKYILQ